MCCGAGQGPDRLVWVLPEMSSPCKIGAVQVAQLWSVCVCAFACNHAGHQGPGLKYSKVTLDLVDWPPFAPSLRAALPRFVVTCSDG